MTAGPSFIAGAVTTPTGAANGGVVCATPASFGTVSETTPQEVSAAMMLGLMRTSVCAPIADGRFSIGLPPGNYRVTASAPHYLSTAFRERDGRTSVVLKASERREDIDIAVSVPAVPVRGTVRDISGGIVEQAVVFGLGGRAFAATDDTGAFTLWVSPSVVELTAFAIGYGSSSAIAHAPIDGISLYLTPESTMRGRVVGSDTNAAVSGVDISMRMAGWPDATTDEAGHFEVHGLTPGVPYRPMVRSHGWCGETETSLFLAIGETLRAVDIVVRPCKAQEVRVLTMPERRPCSGATIEILDYTSVITRRGQTDGDGRANFYDLAPGAYSANISCPGYIPRRGVAWLVEARIERTEWEVTPGGRIKGRVMASSGPKEGVADVKIIFRAADVKLEARTDLSGSFVISGAPAGSGTISAHHSTAPEEVAETIVVPERGGEVQVVLQLIPGVVVRGTVENRGGPMPPGLTIGAYSRDTLARSATGVSQSGAFSFHNLHSQRFAIFPQASGGLRAFDEIEPLAPPVNVDLSDHQPRELHFVVDIKMVDLAVAIVDAEGGPVEDVAVSLKEEMNRYEVQQSLADEAGVARFQVRGDRKYHVEVRTHVGQVVEKSGVSAPGKVTLKLEPLHRVCGGLSVPEATDARGDVIIGTDATAAEVFALKPGMRWCLDRVPPGERTFTARTAQFGTASSTLQISESGEVPEVPLVLSGYVTLSVTLMDAQSNVLANQEIWIVDATGQRIGEGHHTDEQGQLRAEKVPAGDVLLIARPAGFAYSSDEVAQRTVRVSVSQGSSPSTVRFGGIHASEAVH